MGDELSAFDEMKTLDQIESRVFQVHILMAEHKVADAALVWAAAAKKIPIDLDGLRQANKNLLAAVAKLREVRGK